MNAVAIKEKHVRIGPQPGPQTAFLSSPADIAILGGAAFVGKTHALLLEPLRFQDKAVTAIGFRRETPQIRAPGGLWEESSKLYSPLGAIGTESPLEHHFEGGLVVKFSHLQRDADVHNWDGPQLPIILFDQLESFSRYQFFYMLSRNRDPSGLIRPYVRATCNPDAGSWLAGFVSWWIADDGYADLSRSGVIRWMVRNGDDVVWGSSREELIEMGYGDITLPMDHPEQPWLSVTYIPGTIYDNVIGMERDPGYLAKLKSLDRVERERLLGDAKRGGNWKIKASAGLLFKREWCQRLEIAPTNLLTAVRYWDLAATEATPTTNPAWTVGVKFGRYRDSKCYVVLDVRRMQKSPHHVKQAMTNMAIADGHGVRIRIPQDPGQAGKAQVADIVGMLAGYDVRANIESGDKTTRFGPFSAQCEAGNVDYVAGAWNEAFLTSLENFPDGVVKDDADACSGALNAIVGAGTPVDMSEAEAIGGNDSGDDRFGESESSGADSPWSVFGNAA